MLNNILLDRDLPLWEEAKKYLNVRNNNEHTLISYNLAKYFINEISEADESIILPTIILHDVGWKKIDPKLILHAIGRNATRKDLVYEHEKYGVSIAEKILQKLNYSSKVINKIVEIIDGHDTTKHAKSINDAVVKDADKCWRTTPHGINTICSWFNWNKTEYINVLEEIVLTSMLTQPGKIFANGFLLSVKAELTLKNYIGVETV